jgi:hypothetical protein
MYSFRLGPLCVPFGPFDLNEGLLVGRRERKAGNAHF